MDMTVPIRSTTVSPRSRPHRAPVAALVAVAAAVVAAGCATAAAPEAGQSRGYVPTLDGQEVIVFPVQRNLGVQGDATAEMVFALEGPGAGPRWLFPDELRRVLARSPGLDAPLDNLPVDVFLRAQVNRIGDPIYGVMRRIGAVTGADVALLPVAVRPGAPAVDSAGNAVEGHAPAEYVAALLEVRTGRVIWFGIEEGMAGAPDNPGLLASAAEALARRLVPPPPGRSPRPEEAP